MTGNERKTNGEKEREEHDRGTDEPRPRESEGTGGTHGGWDQVAETAQVFEAELMALRLRESGIEAEVVDQTFHQEPLPNVRSFAVVRVLVPKGQADEARRVLAAGLRLPDDAEPDPSSE